MWRVTSDYAYPSGHPPRHCPVIYYACQNDQQRDVNKLVRLIALQYAARKCKQNKRYHTSARLTLAYNRKRKLTILDVRS